MAKSAVFPTFSGGLAARAANPVKPCADRDSMNKVDEAIFAACCDETLFRVDNIIDTDAYTTVMGWTSIAIGRDVRAIDLSTQVAMNDSYPWDDWQAGEKDVAPNRFV